MSMTEITVRCGQVPAAEINTFSSAAVQPIVIQRIVARLTQGLGEAGTWMPKVDDLA
jgi:hypothetical protein